jgi:hypothetical protein
MYIVMVLDCSVACRLRPPSHAISEGSAPSSGANSPRALDFYAPEAAARAAVPTEASLQQDRDPVPVEDSLQQARESHMHFRRI